MGIRRKTHRVVARDVGKGGKRAFGIRFLEPRGVEIKRHHLCQRPVAEKAKATDETPQ